MPDSNGTVHTAEGGSSLRFVRRFDAPINDVWSAITESERLGRWAFPGSIEPRVGGAVHFDYGEHGEAHGDVLIYDEPTTLEYRWGEGDEVWHIRFELEVDGAGTRLTFDHFLPDATQPQFAAGWHWHLDRLALVVSGVEPADVQSDAHFDELMEMYSSGS